MPTLTTRLLQLSFLALLIACALGINYLAAWTGPSTAAPGNNVDAPLNVSATAQSKEGAFALFDNFYAQGIGVNVSPPLYSLDIGPTANGITSGIRFADGTVQTTAGGGSLKAIRTYTASGTWTKPADLSYVVVEVWGGGGAGQNYAYGNGSVGGTSSFGSHSSASGGGNTTSTYLGGVGGIGSNGDLNLRGGTGGGMAGSDGGLWGSGGYGGAAAKGGSGGVAGFGPTRTASDGKAGVVPGGGGGGAGHYHGGGGGTGGGGGGYALKRITAASLSTTETVTIGAGGVGVAHGNGNGGNGAAGMVVVYEY